MPNACFPLKKLAQVTCQRRCTTHFACAGNFHASAADGSCHELHQSPAKLQDLAI